jgi:hypothetical protein
MFIIYKSRVDQFQKKIRHSRKKIGWFSSIYLWMAYFNGTWRTVSTTCQILGHSLLCNRHYGWLISIELGEPSQQLGQILGHSRPCNRHIASFSVQKKSSLISALETCSSKFLQMTVSPRNSPRVVAAKQADTSSRLSPTTIIVVTKSCSSSTGSSGRLSNALRRTIALGRTRIILLTVLLLVGQISFCCNLYIMLWLRQANTSIVNQTNGRGAVAPVLEMHVQGGRKLNSIRSIWSYQFRNEGSSKDEKQSKTLLVQPPDKVTASRQLGMDPNDHILTKEVSNFHLEQLETVPIDRQASLPSDWSMGILSEKSTSFFRNIQRRVDDEDTATRCSRYEGMSYAPNKRRSRKIFFGSLIADEPWELLEIVGTETYGIFAGVVLVESNRTQSFEPRQFQRLHHGSVLQEVFGTPNVQVRAYVNERPRIQPMIREQLQREEILKGWKEMGMGPDDIGYLGDLDETFTRDFLRAVQTCEVDILNYESHQCERAKIVSDTRTFEGSPECLAEKGWWQ